MPACGLWPEGCERGGRVVGRRLWVFLCNAMPAEVDHSENSTEEKPWVLVAIAHAIARPLAVACIFFELLVMTGYLAGIEVLYRPIAGGSATNPLTATSVLLIALGILGASRRGPSVSVCRLFGFVALAVVSIRLLDVLLGTEVSASMTPFQAQVMHDLAIGKSNSMGANSALMLLLTSIALLLFCFRRPGVAQFVSFLALALPTVSFAGYFYGIEDFYGHMSLVTAISGFVLALATLAMTADTGALKALLSPYVGGRIARLQALAGYTVPVFLGFFLVESTGQGHAEAFGVFVVFICWFTVAMVSISAVLQEHVDHQRRSGERLLLEAAMNDPLTGLPNRRRFLAFGHHEVERCKRSGNRLWLLVLDLDYFKRINDTAGHAMGDKVLVEAGSVLGSAVRYVDLASRIGGEEFAVLLVDCTRQGAERVAESIRASLAKRSIDGWSETHGPVTVSVGCASTGGERSLESTLQAADEALYRAKANGRNQVCFAD